MARMLRALNGADDALDQVGADDWLRSSPNEGWTVIFRADKLLTELPIPKHPSAAAAAAVQELMGGKAGEMSTLMNYFFQFSGVIGGDVRQERPAGDARQRQADVLLLVDEAADQFPVQLVAVFLDAPVAVLLEAFPSHEIVCAVHRSLLLCSLRLGRGSTGYGAALLRLGDDRAAPALAEAECTVPGPPVQA